MSQNIPTHSHKHGGVGRRSHHSTRRPIPAPSVDSTTPEEHKIAARAARSKAARPLPNKFSVLLKVTKFLNKVKKNSINVT